MNQIQVFVNADKADGACRMMAIAGACIAEGCSSGELWSEKLGYINWGESEEAE